MAKEVVDFGQRYPSPWFDLILPTSEHRSEFRDVGGRETGPDAVNEVIEVRKFLQVSQTELDVGDPSGPRGFFALMSALGYASQAGGQNAKIPLDGRNATAAIFAHLPSWPSEGRARSRSKLLRSRWDWSEPPSPG